VIRVSVPSRVSVHGRVSVPSRVSVPRRVSVPSRGAVLGATAALLCATATATAPAFAQAPVPAAQLAGTFQMSGTVTVAHLVPGEHAGEAVARTWTFTPLCATAPCATVQLVRTRATGTDTLTLTAVSSNAYAGTGSFYAPLRCAGRLYGLGEMIPFRITVQVTATAPGAAGGPPVASAISATYVNKTRVNLTPCLALLGHDAARYTGQPVAG
jgi:hypothetical protein